MKCSKAKQNHIIHTFAEQSEAHRIDIQQQLYAERSEAKFFFGTISLKTILQLLILISKPQNLSKSKKIGKNRNFSEK